MNEQGCEVRALVRLSPDAPVRGRLDGKVGASVRIHGQRYSGMLLAFDRPLAPGEAGVCTVGTLGVVLEVGDQFELLAGPKLVGTADVLTVIR